MCDMCSGTLEQELENYKFELSRLNVQIIKLPFIIERVKKNIEYVEKKIRERDIELN